MPKVNVSLRLEASDIEKLESIAKSLGICWGDKGNVSAMLRAIARLELVVLSNKELKDYLNNANKIKQLERELLKQEIMKLIKEV